MLSPPTIAQPTFIGGKYRILRPLGSGAWGTVYEAEHGWTHQRVALKLLRPEHSSNREVALRFIAEARAASRVSHPSVVRVLDVGEDADTGALYIVQDLLEGFDLGRMLDREKRLAPHDALDILLPAMGALVALHRAGVVHRDLKPSNLFLARHPERGLVPTVIDFGVARLIDGSGSIRTLTGELGTPEYMAPEQVRGETDVDHRADVGHRRDALRVHRGAHPSLAPTSRRRSSTC
ncbi:MAG: serine/threonine-protein kinase [Polyangiales bacterium]